MRSPPFSLVLSICPCRNERRGGGGNLFFFLFVVLLCTVRSLNNKLLLHWGLGIRSSGALPATRFDRLLGCCRSLSLHIQLHEGSRWEIGVAAPLRFARSSVRGMGGFGDKVLSVRRTVFLAEWRLLTRTAPLRFSFNASRNNNNNNGFDERHRRRREEERIMVSASKAGSRGAPTQVTSSAGSHVFFPTPPSPILLQSSFFNPPSSILLLSFMSTKRLPPLCHRQDVRPGVVVLPLSHRSSASSSFLTLLRTKRTDSEEQIAEEKEGVEGGRRHEDVCTPIEEETSSTPSGFLLFLLLPCQPCEEGALPLSLPSLVPRAGGQRCPSFCPF